jgi:ATP-dependent RNA helicase RhlE
LKDIEKLIMRSIVRVEVEGFVAPPKSELMSDERPPRQPHGRGGQSSGRAGSGRQSQGDKPTTHRNAPAPRSIPPANAPRNGPPAARKPRPPAALFSAKPGTRGH